MTTVVFKDGVLAADTQINSGSGAVCGYLDKIGRTKDGHLWGFSGDVQRQAACATWAEKREGDPPEIEDAVFILVTPEGRAREWWGKGWLETRADYLAWGSGARIAMGAMEAGVDATRAVQIAVKIDNESGGDVTTLKVSEQ